jgi:FtsH-binding integral membrane protein
MSEHHHEHDVAPPGRAQPEEEGDTQLFDAVWGWLTAGLLLIVAAAILSIVASLMPSRAPVLPRVASRPPLDNPANPPSAAAPNTPRTVPSGATR